MIDVIEYQQLFVIFVIYVIIVILVIIEIHGTEYRTGDCKMAASGKKERVVISCVTFETTKITEPVFYYDATKVYLIHYVRDVGSAKGTVYQDFYDRVCELIREGSPRKVDVVERIGSVSNFTVMLKTVLNIIREEEGNDIFINISAGSSEFAAAAAIAAMMNPGTCAFSVGTKEYTIKDDESVKKAYYENGKPIGLTKIPYDPKSLPSYFIKMPEEHLVRALRILHETNESHKSSSSSKMVEKLKENEIWYRGKGEEDISKPGIEGSKKRQSEAVYYHRDFVLKWQENGWVEKDDLLKRYVLTEDGKKIIVTFHDEVDTK
jgi:hypothetical protein